MFTFRCQKLGWGFPSTGLSRTVSVCQADKTWNLTQLEDCICKLVRFKNIKTLNVKLSVSILDKVITLSGFYSFFSHSQCSRVPLHHQVSTSSTFICAAFAPVDPKSVKDTDNLTELLYFWKLQA